MHRLAATALALCLPWAAPAQETHVTTIEGVRILHAWATAQADETGMGHVFLRVENGSDRIVSIAGGTTPVATHVTLMSEPPGHDDSEPIRLPELPVAPNSDGTLEPGGMFLALTGLKEPLVEGESFPLTLELPPFGEAELEVMVEPAEATEHTHAASTN